MIISDQITHSLCDEKCSDGFEYRTIHVFGGAHMPIFLVTVFAKNEKDNLTRTEQAAAVALAKTLVATYGDRR